MADRPIIFSAPMIRALLDGRKNQTRRVLKHKSIDIGIAPTADAGHREWIQFHHPQGGPLTCVKWPYAPGDRLWVREHWRAEAVYDDTPPRNIPFDACMIRYEADGAWSDHDAMTYAGRLRQGRHMPRWASRLTLTVTNVRVQRLQDISEADADAEIFGGRYPHDALPLLFSDPDRAGRMTIPECFGVVWDYLHGPNAWDANPWVCAATFDVTRGNIDAGAV